VRNFKTCAAGMYGCENGGIAINYHWLISQICSCMPNVFGCDELYRSIETAIAESPGTEQFLKIETSRHFWLNATRYDRANSRGTGVSPVNLNLGRDGQATMKYLLPQTKYYEAKTILLVEHCLARPIKFSWHGRLARESQSRPRRPSHDEIPIATDQVLRCHSPRTVKLKSELVGDIGLEPTTSTMSTLRSNQLS
jgi:hypothetical protein